MNRFLHLSDLHFGRQFFFTPEVIDRPTLSALDRLIHRLDPDFLVVTGDLTQRGRELEFRQAREWLEGWRRPCLVLPGNHDLEPYWRPMGRLFSPFATFRRFFPGQEVHSRVLGPYEFFVLPTVRPTRLDRGSVTRRDWARFLSLAPEKPSTRCRVLLSHHPCFDPNFPGRPNHVVNHQTVLHRLAPLGFRLFLSGHVHRPFLGSRSVAGHDLFFATTASSASNRYRPDFRHTNMVNLVCLEKNHCLVRSYLRGALGPEPANPEFVAGGELGFSTGA